MENIYYRKYLKYKKKYIEFKKSVGGILFDEEDQRDFASSIKESFFFSDLEIKNYVIYGPDKFTEIFNNLSKKPIDMVGFNSSILDINGTLVLAVRLLNISNKAIPGNDCKYVKKRKIETFNDQLVDKKVIIDFYYRNYTHGIITNFNQKKQEITVSQELSGGKKNNLTLKESSLKSMGTDKFEIYEIFKDVEKTYDGEDFIWNNWNLGEFINSTILFKIDDQNNLTHLPIIIPEKYRFRLLNTKLLNGLNETDHRIANINDKYYLYSTSFKDFIKFKFNDDNINIEEIFKLKEGIYDGHNFVPITVEHNDDLNISIQYLDWFRGTHLSINSSINGIPDYRIPFNNPGLYGNGSHHTDLQEDKDTFKSFYGKTPGFSFNAPLIVIHEDDNEKHYMSTGHVKIRNPKEKYSYLSDSKVEKFKNFLDSYMDKKYPKKYKLHMGSEKAPFCNGYIYLMYFYKLIYNKNDEKYQFKFSDSYLPINESLEHNDKYKFSLIFPMGIVKRGDDIIVSAGEGDYYSILLTFSYDKINFRHDIEDFEIDNYDYYILSYTNE